MRLGPAMFPAVIWAYTHYLHNIVSDLSTSVCWSHNLFAYCVYDSSYSWEMCAIRRQGNTCLCPAEREPCAPPWRNTASNFTENPSNIRTARGLHCLICNTLPGTGPPITVATAFHLPRKALPSFLPQGQLLPRAVHSLAQIGLPRWPPCGPL